MVSANLAKGARSRATKPKRALEPAAAGDEELQIKLVLAGRIDGEENHGARRGRTITSPYNAWRAGTMGVPILLVLVLLLVLKNGEWGQCEYELATTVFASPIESLA